LLTMVELYYIHMQHLKEAGFVRPRISEKQLNASKCRANKIPNEDCVADDTNNNEYWVRSQNKDTRDTWYNVIYRGSTLHFCNCNWALNGNVCKHVLKVEMLASNTVLGDNIMPNVSIPIIERHKNLFDLNETAIMSPEFETQLPPCFNSPPNHILHNETNTDDVENSSHHVDSTIVRLDSALLEDDEMKNVISSTQEYLRGFSSMIPTNLEQAYLVNNIVANAYQECHKKFFNTVTPSKISIKRRHSFLSPIKRKRKCGRNFKARTDKGPQFQKVGRVRAKKRNMNEQLELASRRKRNLEQALHVQHPVLQNIGMEF